MIVLNIPHVLVALTAIGGCAHDLHDRRIPNYLTFGSGLLAFCYGWATGGWSGLGVAVAGWGLAVGIFIPFFLLRGMGGGDVKLMGALGAWIGPASLLSLTFYTAIAGGVMALIVVLWQRKVATTAANIWLLLCHWRAAGVRPLPALSLENHNSARLAYGIPIAVGAMVTIWLH